MAFCLRLHPLDFDQLTQRTRLLGRPLFLAMGLCSRHQRVATPSRLSGGLLPSQTKARIRSDARVCHGQVSSWGFRWTGGSLTTGSGVMGEQGIHINGVCGVFIWHGDLLRLSSGYSLLCFCSRLVAQGRMGRGARLCYSSFAISSRLLLRGAWVRLRLVWVGVWGNGKGDAAGEGWLGKKQMRRVYMVGMLGVDGCGGPGKRFLGRIRGGWRMTGCYTPVIDGMRVGMDNDECGRCAGRAPMEDLTKVAIANGRLALRHHGWVDGGVPCSGRRKEKRKPR